MKLIPSCFLASFMTVVSLPVCAEAEVVDDSQNYALNQQASQFAPELGSNSAARQGRQSEEDSEPFAATNSQNQVYQQRVQADPIPNTDSEAYQLLLSKIDALQQEISQLRGKVEEQEYLLNTVRGGDVSAAKPVIKPVTSQPTSAELPQQKTIPYEEKPQSALAEEEQQKPKSAAKLSRSDDPMDEQLSYVAAYEHVKQHRYEQAVGALQEFISVYPDGPYTANSHYWLGELFLKKRQYNHALGEFKKIVESFSDSNKLAPARYKMGVVYERLGDKDIARAQFVKVTEQFPGTAIARLAKSKIS